MTDTKALGPSNDHIPAAEFALAHFRARIEQRNQEFMTSSKESQRVQLAKDVVKWLRTGKILARHVGYMFSIEDSSEEGRVDGGRCTVCALGGLVACAVERLPLTRYTNLDYMVVGRTSAWTIIRRVLGPFFDNAQLRNIEAAYERTTSLGGSITASLYGQRLDGDDGMRMTAIMKNIIRNHGTFVPTDSE